MNGWEVATVAAKCLLYVTVLQACGGALFLAALWGRLSHLERQFSVACTRVISVAAVGVISTYIAVLSGMLGDGISSMWDWTLIQIILEGSEGRAAALRVIGLVAIAVATFETVWSRMIAVLGAFSIAASFGATGHVGALDQNSIVRALIVAHVLGVAYWVGSLVPLLYVISGKSVEFDRVAMVLERFSGFALFAVGSLVLAGAIVLWTLLGGFDGLLNSPYGQFFAVKLFLVGGLIGAAAINKLRLTPGVVAHKLASLKDLRRSIALEIVLVVAILITTGIFTTLTGPTE